MLGEGVFFIVWMEAFCDRLPSRPAAWQGWPALVTQPIRFATSGMGQLPRWRGSPRRSDRFGRKMFQQGLHPAHPEAAHSTRGNRVRAEPVEAVEVAQTVSRMVESSSEVAG